MPRCCVWGTAGGGALARLCVETACDFACSIVAEHWSEARHRARALARAAHVSALGSALLLGVAPLMIAVKALVAASGGAPTSATAVVALVLHCATMYALVRVLPKLTARGPGERGSSAQATAAAARTTRLALLMSSAAMLVVAGNDLAGFLALVRISGGRVLVLGLGLTLSTVIATAAFTPLRPPIRRAGVRRLGINCA